MVYIILTGTIRETMRICERNEEAIRPAKSPTIAARMGRSRKNPVRADWEGLKDEIMREAVRAKFEQHMELREILPGTDDRYWGDGGDGLGANMLGEILMAVREKLKDEATFI
jgi:ribA/ribD-fused uncharacterized protein